MNIRSRLNAIINALKIKVRKKLKPGDLSRLFANRKKISLVANTNGGFANSYRTVISASIVSENFKVKVNEFKFHPVENIDFFVDELNLYRSFEDDLPSYGGWVIPHINFYRDYRDTHCFNLLNQYGLYHDVCELALYPEYYNFILEKSKFLNIKEKYLINDDLSTTLGVQLRVWEEEPKNSTLLVDDIYSNYKELNWGKLIFHNVVDDASLSLMADKVERVSSETNSTSVFISCNQNEYHKKIESLLEDRGIVILNPKNTFKLSSDVFDFVVLSNCRSILRSPGSTFGHLATIFRNDLSYDFII